MFESLDKLIIKLITKNKNITIERLSNLLLQKNPSLKNESVNINSLVLDKIKKNKKIIINTKFKDIKKYELIYSEDNNGVFSRIEEYFEIKRDDNKILLFLINYLKTNDNISINALLVFVKENKIYKNIEQQKTIERILALKLERHSIFFKDSFFFGYYHKQKETDVLGRIEYFEIIKSLLKVNIYSHTLTFIYVNFIILLLYNFFLNPLIIIFDFNKGYYICLSITVYFSILYFFITNFKKIELIKRLIFLFIVYNFFKTELVTNFLNLVSNYNFPKSNSYPFIPDLFVLLLSFIFCNLLVEKKIFHINSLFFIPHVFKNMNKSCNSNISSTYNNCWYFSGYLLMLTVFFVYSFYNYIMLFFFDIKPETTFLNTTNYFSMICFVLFFYLFLHYIYSVYFSVKNDIVFLIEEIKIIKIKEESRYNKLCNLVNGFYFFIGKDKLSNSFLIDSDEKKSKKNLIICYLLLLPVFMIFLKENSYKILYYSFYEVVNDGYCSNLNLNSYIIKINNGKVLYREENSNFIRESSCDNEGYKFDMDLFLKGEKKQ